LIAADAVDEARAAIRSRFGLSAIAAGIGFDTIQRIRPGLLQKHVYALLPDLASAVEPFWLDGLDSGRVEQHFENNDMAIADALIGVVDDYVDQATDRQQISIYKQLRGNAPKRIAEQMPRLARFIDRHTTPPPAAGPGATAP